MASTTIPHRAWVEQVMGMPVSVHVRGQAARADDTARLVYAAFEELRVIDARFSTYSADSEVSRLNRAELSLAAGHPSMSEVLELCEVARKRTGGHFNAHRPDPAAHGERRFDPSGLVKGWAIEQMAARLARSTGCDVSVNAGGDIAGDAGGQPGTPWRIGVEDPRQPARLIAVLPLSTGGIATSGTARRGRHIVDPKDGYPVDDLLSVTVVGPSLLWADVYATAAFVKGPKALPWLEAVPDYDGIVVDRNGVYATSGLADAARPSGPSWPGSHSAVGRHLPAKARWNPHRPIPDPISRGDSTTGAGYA